MTDYSKFKVLVDLPSKFPGLGFQETANGLRDLIMESEPRFSIAIFGPWGSGKTTLMNAIKRQLEKPENSIVVDFSAWRYEREEHLIVPLLDSIRAALVSWAEQLVQQTDKRGSQKSKLSRAGLAAAETVGKVMASVLAGLSFKLAIPGALEMSYEANKSLEAGRQYGSGPSEAAVGPGKDGLWQRFFGVKVDRGSFSKRLFDPKLPQSFYHACFSALEQTFEQFAKETNNARIVVFVDDLDRCLPAGALEVLESMKLFFDLHGFVFVVGLDREVVERCIDSRYVIEANGPEGVEKVRSQTHRQLIRGSDYLKKIFQVPFSLAPVSYNMLDDLFDSMQQGAGLIDSQKIDMRDTVRPHLNNLFSGARLNPREVKRYINAYTIQMKVKPNLQDPNIVLALNTLAFRQDCRSLYDAIATFRIEVTSALREYLAGATSDLEEYDLNAGDLPDDIRQYLGEGGIAHALIISDDIDGYLDAGEAARSSAGGYFLELLSIYREFRQGILNAFNVNDPKTIDGSWMSANSVYGKLKEFLSSFSKSDAPMRALVDLDHWLDASNRDQKWQRWIDSINNDEPAEGIEQARKEAIEEAKSHLKILQLELRRLRWQAQMET